MKTTPPDPADPGSPLAADVQALITAGQAAGPLDARAGARVKSALLGRIAQAQAGLLTVQRDTAAADAAAATAGADGPCWQPFLPGIRIKVLHEWQGVMSYLLHFAPGAVLPGHRHPHDEECVVLEGALQIGDELVVRAGGFHMAHQGELHAPIRSPEGAVIYLRGAVPEAAQLF